MSKKIGVHSGGLLLAVLLMLFAIVAPAWAGGETGTVSGTGPGIRVKGTLIGVQPNKQKIILGQYVQGPVFGTASATWMPGGSLVTTVFNDLNMDGAIQDGESVLSGWTVTVLGRGSKTTDANGNASWLLPSGTYTVTLTPKSGWLETTPLTQTVTVSADEGGHRALRGEGYAQPIPYREHIAHRGQMATQPQVEKELDKIVNWVYN